MTLLEEIAIREAVRNGDGRLMAETVQGMFYPDFDEVVRVVEESAGNWNAVCFDGIHVGNTVVRNQYGTAKVRS